MNISDEQLSAFMDAELAPEDMEMIRAQLAEDEQLADRLADLALADMLVANSYQHIDQRPLPQAVAHLIADTQQPANVITFPLWRRFGQRLHQHAAVAAGVLLLAGFTLTQMLHDTANPTPYDWKNIAQVLETVPSGIDRDLTSGIQVKPRATFMNRQHEYCRQFRLQNLTSASENIACRDSATWQLVSTISTSAVKNNMNYQTASGDSAMDEQVENIIAGDFLDAHAESMLLTQHWTQ